MSAPDDTKEHRVPDAPQVTVWADNRTTQLHFEGQSRGGEVQDPNLGPYMASLVWVTPTPGQD